MSIVAFAPFMLSSVATSAATPTVPPCTSATVRITDYNTVVGAGNVNDLFWVHNVSQTTCSLRGYVRVAYIGSYGLSSKGKKPIRLAVAQVDSLGANGNDVGGVKRGVAIPTVTLRPKSVASFWIYGTDEPHGLPDGHSSRCITSYKMLAWLPGAAKSMNVSPMRANGYYWCGGVSVHPIVAGLSGSIPARPLTYYFGTSG
ncbi:MAG TPA: hypothetical protein VGZ04_11200 [Acidimicrobiales bacterium]|nr:hypothetical protein [Acidimicrobiales bacterium]